MRTELIVISLVAVIIVSAASGYLFLSQPAPTVSTTSVQTTGSITTKTASSSHSSSTSSSSHSYYTSSSSQSSSTTAVASSSISSSSATTTTTEITTSLSTSSVSSQTSHGTDNSLPDCGSKTQFFSAPPMNLSDFVGITPLGNLNPPRHVLPTDHLYFALRYVNQSKNGWLTERVPVVAPGNLTILQISSNNYSPTSTDYLIYFWPCSQFYAYFDHVTSLSPDLQALFAPPFDRCQTYVGGSGRQSCTKIVHVPVQAGEYLGTAGGVQNGSSSLDFGAVDFRVAPLAYAVPSHYYSFQLQKVCAIDYYTPTVADVLRSRLGSWDGHVHRTASPVCGSVDQDVVGTAQGNWFGHGMVFPVQDESQAIALVHDNVNVSRGVFSIGSSMAGIGLTPGAYYFAPKSTGFVNLDFQDLQPGQIYCYETAPQYVFGNYPRTVILVQLLDASTLRIGLPATPTSSCGTGPWVFTANFADFQR